MVRVHAGRRVEESPVRASELQRRKAAVDARSGDDDCRDAVRARAVEHHVEIVPERFVGQVGADVDEWHGSASKVVVAAQRAATYMVAASDAIPRSRPGFGQTIGVKDTQLPIDALLPDVRRVLQAATRLVLVAPPGAGKTTRVAPALLDEAWLDGRRIVMLEPRRVAARAAAAFMSEQRGEPVGQAIGFRIRHETKVSPATRIEVVTEGILTRMIQADPELTGIGAVVFDEFHERHLHGDLGAALALDVQANLRPDLRLVVMSATLPGPRLDRWFDAPRVVSEGRAFPVAIVHPAMPPRANAAFALRAAVTAALAGHDGGVLVFLPGRREIARAGSMLRAAVGADVDIIPLHGDLPLAAQRAALAASADGKRRVVLATNLAESSVTLPGIRTVVDSGLAREPRFDPASGLTRLETVSISQASADQRAGRAGRLGPGACYRLWPRSQRLDADRTPEIGVADLAPLALELAAWGSDDLRWLDPPPPGALAQARDLLRALGALDPANRVTPFGRRVNAFGAHPRLAAAVLRADAEHRALACDVAALVEARDPRRGTSGRNDDFRSRIDALRAWRTAGHSAQSRADGDPAALAEIARSAAHWRRLAGAREVAGAGTGDASAAGAVLQFAFPDRIAHVDPGDPRRYVLANGRGARLGEDSSLAGQPWLAVVELRHEQRDGLIWSAAPVDEAAIVEAFPGRFVSGRVVRWNRDRHAVEAFDERRFDAIVLVRSSVPVRSGDAVPGLLDAVRSEGLDVLPWNDAARQLRARVRLLRKLESSASLPDWSDETLLGTLEDWLGPTLAGKRSLAQLSEAQLTHALEAALGHAARRLLAAQTPTAWRVPSGRELHIDYMADAGPVLAVKLQELFGLADTPRIANGRVPLTLHLLSPAARPVQVTEDLRGFWERTYPEVRKELKGRYPKHPWPEDPWTATPTHRAKPRRP